MAGAKRDTMPTQRPHLRIRGLVLASLLALATSCRAPQHVYQVTQPTASPAASASASGGEVLGEVAIYDYPPFWHRSNGQRRAAMKVRFVLESTSDEPLRLERDAVRLTIPSIADRRPEVVAGDLEAPPHGSAEVELTFFLPDRWRPIAVSPDHIDGYSVQWAVRDGVGTRMAETSSFPARHPRGAFPWFGMGHLPLPSLPLKLPLPPLPLFFLLR